MTDRDRAAIVKLVCYINETISFIEGMTKAEFALNRKTIAAVAFNIGQMGELARIITEGTQAANAQVPWKEIRGMRNHIIHDYESVDLSVIWSTITSDLPQVLLEINKIISQS